MSTKLKRAIWFGVMFIPFLSASVLQNSFARSCSQKAGLLQGDNNGGALNYIFKNGDDGYACYRIPAIVRTRQGTLLAFAEGRKGGCSDTGDIDLLLKRSFDGGKTWGKLQVLWDDADNTCGNPAPVVDGETGEIILLATWNLGEDHEKEIIRGEGKDTRRVFVSSSVDDGTTWKPMKDITKKVKRKNWTWYATGPVSGIQLKNSKYAGRLVIPCDHIVADSIKGYAHVIYSERNDKLPSATTEANPGPMVIRTMN